MRKLNCSEARKRMAGKAEAGNEQKDKDMNRSKLGKVAVLLGAAVLWAVASTSAMASLVFTGSGVNAGSGTALAGSATFTATGDQLQLVLENTGDAARVNSDVMTGIFFNWAGVSLTAESASTPTLLHPESNGNTLGGGWACNSLGNGTTGIGVWGGGGMTFSPAR